MALPLSPKLFVWDNSEKSQPVFTDLLHDSGTRLAIYRERALKFRFVGRLWTGCEVHQPRARQLYQLDGQWIAEEPGRPGLYRFWNDPGTGRTRRARLISEDIEAAKKELAQIVLVGQIKTNDSHLLVVLENYFVDKTDYLASRQSARNAGRLFSECWGALFKVRSLTDERQKRFVEWSLERNHAISTISRNLGVLAAAVAHADAPVLVGL